MWNGIPIDKLSAPVLLGITFLMILFGVLVPRYVYRAKEKESETYRLAYEAERKARAISDKQTAELLELAKTSHSVLVALFNTTERLNRAGGDLWESSTVEAKAQPRTRKRRGLLQMRNNIL
jgi:hypothetical protein